MQKLLVCVCLAALLTACGNSEPIDPEIEKLGRATGPSAAVEKRTMPPGMMGARNTGEGPSERIVYEGELLESIDVPNYTYLRFKTKAGEEIWAAVPQYKAEVGKPVRVVQSLVMKGFTSPSLSRTFDEIIFGTLADQKPPMQRDDKNGLPAGHPPLEGGEMPAQGAIKEMPPGHPELEKKPEPAAQEEAALPPGHPPIKDM